MSERPLDMYVLYDSPSDFPGWYVVRKQVLKPGRSQYVPEDDIFFKHTDLQVVRTLMEHKLGLYFWPRSMGDLASIMGCYI